MTFLATANTTYLIAVDGADGAGGAAQGSFEIDISADPPANDDFAAAEDLGGGLTATASGTNVAATREPGEPAHAGQTAGVSVWYRWTAPQSGRFELDLCGSSYDTIIAVYTGVELSTLAPVATEANYCGVGSSSVFTAVAGTTYMIAVDGVQTAEGEIDLDLHLRRPANDNFANASEIYGSALSIGANSQATKETGEPAHAGDPGGASVWYRWTAPASRRVTIETCAADFDTVLGVYTGNAVSGLTAVASADNGCASGTGSRIEFDAVSGARYAIAIDGRGAAEGAYELRVRLQPPPNDDFAAAQDLGGGATATATGSNLWATRETGEPSHGWGSAASVWYHWVAPSSGQVEIDLCGSGYDTTLSVYTGSGLGSLQPLAGNDDWCGLDSRVTFTATAGTTYRIVVDGYYGDEGSIALQLRYASDPPPPPPPPPTERPANDHVVFATPISGSLYAGSGSNWGATRESWESGHAGDPGGASVWYQLSAPANGPVYASLCSSEFDTLLAVYGLNTSGRLAPVAANDDACGDRSFVSFVAEQGKTYWLAIDGAVDAAGAPSQGSFLLQLAQHPSALPPGGTFRPDTTAPDTFVTRGPGPRPGSPRPRFYFASNEPPVEFQCALDSQSFKPCESGDRFEVRYGKHTLRVRARDLSRNKDATPAVVTWVRKRR